MSITHYTSSKTDATLFLFFETIFLLNNWTAPWSSRVLWRHHSSSRLKPILQIVIRLKNRSFLLLVGLLFVQTLSSIDIRIWIVLVWKMIFWYMWQTILFSNCWAVYMNKICFLRFVQWFLQYLNIFIFFDKLKLVTFFVKLRFLFPTSHNCPFPTWWLM